MFGVEKNIETIEALLAEGSPQSITYAALECRLTIEQICYQRLSFAHDYISHDDIKKWQPRDVVKTLIQEVDPGIVSNLEVAIGARSSKHYEDNPSEKVEYLNIGTQVGFNANRMGKLWNALSHVSLHVQIPKTKSDDVVRYKDSEVAKKKIEECLIEFRKIAETTLMVTGVGSEVSFECCSCQTQNKRKSYALSDGKIINCINFACNESFKVEKQDQEFFFERRVVVFPCSCENKISLCYNDVAKLKIGQSGTVICSKCNVKNIVIWQLQHGMHKVVT